MEGPPPEGEIWMRKEKKKSKNDKEAENVNFFVPFDGSRNSKTFKASAFEDSVKERFGEDLGGFFGVEGRRLVITIRSCSISTIETSKFLFVCLVFLLQSIAPP